MKKAKKTYKAVATLRDITGSEKVWEVIISSFFASYEEAEESIKKFCKRYEGPDFENPNWVPNFEIIKTEII